MLWFLMLVFMLAVERTTSWGGKMMVAREGDGYALLTSLSITVAFFAGLVLSRNYGASNTMIWTTIGVVLLVRFAVRQLGRTMRAQEQ